jgi:protein-tyrosine phosphatase
MTNVLFVCTGNINRSASAHVILEFHGAGRFVVKSCGTGKVAPRKCKMPKRMLMALGEMGYGGAGHRSQIITPDLVTWADIIVCMGRVHEKFINTHYPEHVSGVVNWLVKDPHFAPGVETHRAVAKEIKERVLDQFF